MHTSSLNKVPCDFAFTAKLSKNEWSTSNSHLYLYSVTLTTLIYVTLAGLNYVIMK